MLTSSILPSLSLPKGLVGGAQEKAAEAKDAADKTVSGRLSDGLVDMSAPSY